MRKRVIVADHYSLIFACGSNRQMKKNVNRYWKLDPSGSGHFSLCLSDRRRSIPTQ
jgi:hypothetical protein